MSKNENLTTKRADTEVGLPNETYEKETINMSYHKKSILNGSH